MPPSIGGIAGGQAATAARIVAPLKTPFDRRSDMGVVARIMAGPTSESIETGTIVIDATVPKADRTAPNLPVEKADVVA